MAEVGLASLKVTENLDGWFANQFAIWINVIVSRFGEAMTGKLIAAPENLDLGQLFQVFQPLLNTVALDLVDLKKRKQIVKLQYTFIKHDITCCLSFSSSSLRRPFSLFCLSTISFSSWTISLRSSPVPICSCWSVWEDAIRLTAIKLQTSFMIWFFIFLK